MEKRIGRRRDLSIESLSKTACSNDYAVFGIMLDKAWRKDRKIGCDA